MKKNIETFVRNKYVSFLFILSLLIIAFLFSPYGIDDYSFSLNSTGTSFYNCIIDALNYGNGRFLGNLFLYLSVNSYFFRIFAKPLLLTILCFSINSILENKSIVIRLITDFLIIFPSSLFTAYLTVLNPVFFNYVAPISFFCLALSLVKYCRNSGSSRMFSYVFLVLIFIFSACSALCSENSTFVFLIISFFIVIASIKKNKTCNCIFSISLLLGELLGLFIMYLIPKKFDHLFEMSEYRSVDFSLNNIILNIETFAQCIISVVPIFIFITVAQLIVANKNNLKLRKLSMTISCTICLIFILYSRLSLNSCFRNDWFCWSKSLLTVLLVIYFLNTLYIIINSKNQIKTVYLIYILIILISVAMIIITNRANVRTFYLTTFLMITFSVFYFKDTVSDIKFDINNAVKPFIKKSLIIAFSGYLMFFTFCMVQNFDFEIIRHKYITEQVQNGEKIIYAPKDPVDTVYASYFNDFGDYYEQKYSDVEIRLAEYASWEKTNYYRQIINNPIVSIKYAIDNFEIYNEINNDL